MAFEDLKDQVRDQVSALWGRVQESTAYNNFKEQYDTWPTILQRSLAFGVGALIVLFIFSIPYSYIDSANTSIGEFTEYRMLLRDLLRIGRAAKEPSPLPPGVSSSELQGQVQALLQEFNLVDEQITPPRPLGERPAGPLAPPVIHQEGVALTLKKLNLNQVLDVGFRLQTLSAGIKLTGFDLIANREDNHYFDVTYKIVSFSLPMTASEVDEGPATPKGRIPPPPQKGPRPPSGQGDEE